jgi:hypothetical protein
MESSRQPEFETERLLPTRSRIGNFQLKEFVI